MTAPAQAQRPATGTGKVAIRSDASDGFADHGGSTREDGPRFREMMLSRGNTMELEEV